MQTDTREPLLGRGVTAAYLTFNQAGVGSNPSDPMQIKDYRPALTRLRGECARLLWRVAQR